MKFRAYGYIKDSKTAQAIAGVIVKVYLDEEELQEGKSAENGFYEIITEIDDSRIESGQQLNVTFEKEGFEKQENMIVATEGSFNLDVKLMPVAPPVKKPFNWLPVIITGGAVVLLIIIGIVVLWIIKPKTKDIKPPELDMIISPSKPTSEENIIFTATAKDPGGLSKLQIFVNGTKVEECTGSPCKYIGGPFNTFNQRIVKYEANAYDKAGNKGSTGSRTLVIGNLPTSYSYGSGQTKPGATDWKPYEGGKTGIYVDVDTSSAGFTKPPVYFTSLGGISSHWATTGGTSIYDVTEKGFRIYLRFWNGQDITPQTANANQWNIQWVGIESGGACGQTKPGVTDWKPYEGGKTGIYVDVDTSSAGFTKPPVYFTSLGGISSHWATTGGTSIYDVTEKGFRIYLRFWNGQDVTPQTANANQWNIQWVGIESGGACGQTKPGATDWKPYEGGKTGIYVDVDTSSAGFTKPPVYFTSLGGISSHWATTGGTSIYDVTEKGFRIYLRFWNGQDVTPQIANANQWYIQWVGIL